MSGASEGSAAGDGSAAGGSTTAGKIRTSLRPSRRRTFGGWRLFGRGPCRPAMALVVSAIGVTLVTRLLVGDAASDTPGSAVTVTNESGLATTINVAGFPVVAATNPF